MTAQPKNEIALLDKFAKSAQYIMGLSARQDVWEHLGNLIITYFKAGWTASVQQDPAGKLVLEYCSLPDPAIAETLVAGEIPAIIRDVLETGFITWRFIAVANSSMIVFLPVAGERRTGRVFLIGHQQATPVSGETLNIYLALAGLAGTMMDRLQVESELEEHRAHLEDLVKARTADLAKAQRDNELILNSIGEGIVGVDIHGNISFANPAASQLTGWEVSELIGRNAHETFHHTLSSGKHFPIEECPIQDALKNGTMHRMTDERFFCKNGTEIVVEYKITPITEENGIIGAVLVFRNVTEERLLLQARLRAEEDLRWTAENLARSNRDLEQFAYVSSHDLKEPLRTVSSFVQLLKQNYGSKLDEKAGQYIQYAVEGAKRMEQLIEDLLAYSRVERKGRKPALTSAEKGLQRALANLRVNIEEHKAEITNGELPVVRADATQLTQLFQNLISNAIKFHGEQAPKIHIEARRDGGHWLFSLQDNGIGIDPAFTDKIFVIFQQLHNRGKYPGTGIGLAICKRIVERHGGRIWVESTPGMGATFCFTLPDEESASSAS